MCEYNHLNQPITLKIFFFATINYVPVRILNDTNLSDTHCTIVAACVAIMSSYISLKNYYTFVVVVTFLWLTLSTLNISTFVVNLTTINKNVILFSQIL